MNAEPFALARLVADSMVSVQRGSIDYQNPADVQAMFSSYFDRVRYLSWEDMVEPVVRISPGGRMVNVARQVKIGREIIRFGGSARREELVLAWTTTYEKSGDQWQMTTVTTTEKEVEPTANTVLAAARRAVGGVAEVRSIAGMSLLADASGPGGPPYQVEITSTIDGAIRLDFSPGLKAGIWRDGSWIVMGAGESVRPLSDTLETFVRGHDVFMNLVMPEVRYLALHFAGVTQFEGTPALMVTGQDALGGVVELFYARRDTIPLGFRVVDHLRGRRPVVTTVDQWASDGEIRVFRRVVFRQGSEVFEYRIRAIQQFTSRPDSLFRKP